MVTDDEPPVRILVNTQRLRVAAGVLVVLLVLGALLVVAGVGPFGGNGASTGEFPTATGTPFGGTSGGGGSSAGGGSTAAGTTTTTPPFQFQVLSIESCGQTCRNVTARLTNNQDREATGVTVYTRIFAGNGTDGDVVWQGQQDVGTLGPGESYTGTRQVNLGVMDAYKIQQNDGHVTIQTTVKTDQRTATFVSYRDVS